MISFSLMEGLLFVRALFDAPSVRLVVSESDMRWQFIILGHEDTVMEWCAIFADVNACCVSGEFCFQQGW